MSRVKIAPTLQRFLPHFDLDGTLFTEDEHKAAAAELRALLAVARAAKEIRRVDGDGCNTEVPTDYWDALQKLNRASARLDRANRRKP